MQKNRYDLLTIGQVAERSGLTVATLRFYEDKKLIFSIRTNGNQRRYARHILRRLAIIKVAQKVGLSLQEIHQAFAKLPIQKAPNKQDWQEMSAQWQHLLEEKIHLLQNMQKQLDWCIGCGCLSVAGCPLRNPEDQFAKQFMQNPEIPTYWIEDYIEADDLPDLED